MGRIARRFFAPLAILVTVAAIIWSAWVEPLPPADFTVSNSTEIKTIDPVFVSGQPEGFVIRALFEGLVDWDAKDLHVIPGSAERWELSDDQLTYTFHIRRDAKWSNGDPVTAHDFEYSLRRFLDPINAAEYVFLLGQVVNAEKYNTEVTEVGDPVEVELLAPPADGPPFARNELLIGKLVAKDKVVLKPAEDDQPEKATWIYTVETEGGRRRFCPGYKEAPDLDADVERCTQVLIDFNEVGVKALDDYRLQIRLKNPTPYFLQLMGFYPLFPVHRGCVEEYGYPEWTKPENAVCNGPFMMTHRRIRDRIRVVRNPHFWDQENIHLDTVDILAVESLTTELNMYLKGQIEYFRQVPAPIVPILLEQKREDFKPVPYLNVYFYKLNTDVKPLNDVRVRKALWLAVNRRELVDKVTRAGQIPAFRFVPPGIPDYEEAKRRAGELEVELDYEESVARAKQLLVEAGYPNGEGIKPLRLGFNSNDLHSQIAELLQAQWKEHLGIDIRLESKEWATHLSDIRKENYDIARQGWIGDYVDPNTFLDLYLTDGPQNNTNWSSAKYDQILNDAASVKLTAEERDAVAERIRKDSDATGEQLEKEIAEAQDYERRIKRQTLLIEAENIILEELPIIPIYYYVTQSITRPWVEGWYQNVQDVHPFRGVRINKELKAKMIREGLK